MVSITRETIILSLVGFFWNGDDRCWQDSLCGNLLECGSMKRQNKEQRKQTEKNTGKDKTMKDSCTVGNRVK